MNKFTKLFAAGLFVVPFVANSQVNVSTTPEKKTAVLEEYTGNYCTYCPDGHLRADDIVATTNAIAIKIQTGGFSGTDPVFGGTLQTPTGELIAAPFDSQGYPNGSVSRASGYTGIGRGDWKAAAQAINTQDAPVNLHVSSTVDVANRTLEVTAEYYYTATEANATNYLHIGYYQDNIAAYQYDPGFNPDQFYLLAEEIYEFDHAYRDNVNGTWGEAIATTTAGSTAILTRSITMPANFSTFDLEAGAVHVYAFISTSAQGDILNAANSSMTYSNFPNSEEIGVIYVASEKNENCPDATGSVSPVVLMTTLGGNDLVSYDTDYDINGSAASYGWTGNEAHNEKFVVTLDPASFVWDANNSLSLTVSNPNSTTDGDNSNNSGSGSWKAGKAANANKIQIKAKVDQYGSAESTWELYDGSGAKIAQSGKISNSSTETVDVEIPEGVDCYTLTVIDSYGDGWGDGSYAKIYDITGGSNKLIHTLNTEDMGSEFTGAVELTSTRVQVSVDENSLTEFSIYPNPTNGNANVEFNVASTNNVAVNVINTLGQVVLNNNLGVVSGAQKVNINGSNLENGIYFVTIKVGDKTTTQKLTVSK